METAMSTVRQLPETKQQIEIFADQLEQGLNNGRIVASELLRFQKAMEKVFDKVKPTLIDCALAELDKYEKNTIIKNTEFSIVEAGTKYDYSMCNDAELNDLYLSMDLLKEKVKHRETFLKALKEPLSIIDEETGDLQRVHPPKKSSSTTVKVTFK
jgi:hypothetical protein